MPGYFHWNVDPIMVHLGPLAIRWYGLCFAAAFLVGYWIMEWVYRQEGKKTEVLDTLLMYMLVGAVVGARLGHVLFYDPHYYFAHPMDILKIWEGGLASHGGAIGILIAFYIYTRRAGAPRYLWLLDRAVIPTALGGFFIRMGNFFNSEIVGTRTTGWWGVVFDRVDPFPRHPVQLYEALAYLLIFFVLLVVYAQQRERLGEGMLLGLFFALVFSARFVLEFVKTPQAEYEAGFVLTVGQLLSIPFVIGGVALMLRARRANAVRPTGDSRR
ncbi:MAG TPA: prolipoprotein diacylglyceryl transferase [Candidatus Baltobacteraceae bacterium]|nr:prolipoprotein diacylglyceryl transferase [Candidatus Baltobacteraceae bacterium]